VCKRWPCILSRATNNCWRLALWIPGCQGCFLDLNVPRQGEREQKGENNGKHHPEFTFQFFIVFLLEKRPRFFWDKNGMIILWKLLVHPVPQRGRQYHSVCTYIFTCFNQFGLHRNAWSRGEIGPGITWTEDSNPSLHMQTLHPGGVNPSNGFLYQELAFLLGEMLRVPECQIRYAASAFSQCYKGNIYR